jgi:hypothetical protein
LWDLPQRHETTFKMFLLCRNTIYIIKTWYWFQNEHWGNFILVFCRFYFRFKRYIHDKTEDSFVC